MTTKTQTIALGFLLEKVKVGLPNPRPNETRTTNCVRICDYEHFICRYVKFPTKKSNY